MERFLTTSVLALLFSMSNLAFGQETLGGKQIKDLLVGNTLQADYREAGERRHTFYEYFSEDGKIFGDDKRAAQAHGYTKYLGTWEIKDGQFCTQIGYGHRGGCSVFEKTGNDSYVRAFDGFKIDDVKIHKGRHHPKM